MPWNPKYEWQKLLQETTQRTLLKEDKVETWEDFKQIMAVAIKAKELEKMSTGGEAAGKAAKNLLKLIPGIGTVTAAMDLGGQFKDLADVVRSSGDLKDKQAEKSEILSYFNIDDGYSELVDDRLEDEFLKWLPGWISDKSGPIDPEMDNVNDVFEAFLKQRGNFDETVTDAEEMRKFTDMDKPEDEGKFKDAVKSVGKFAKGFFSGLV